ncbi:MAG: hypothetical protein JEZ11_11995 [Desulfobacterales bacterium]|nr:hypothetical protein [Desulfobacterales bacterium]
MNALKVAVVDGGNGSYTVAGDVALTGHAVRMWPGARDQHAELYQTQTITVEGLGRTGRPTLPHPPRGPYPRAGHLPVGGFPARNTDAVFKRISQLYPALMASIGIWCGVPTPIASSLLTLIGILAAEDFTLPGRPLNNLGVANLSPQVLSNLLWKGFDD